MKRGSYSPEFKAEVALAAITSGSPRQTAIKYGVDPASVKNWRDILLSKAPEVYEKAIKKPPVIEYHRRPTRKTTTLAKAFLYVFSKKRNRHKKHAKIRKLPTLPIDKIDYRLPSYPEDYINSLKPEERPLAVFLYNTRAEMPWMGPRRLAEYMQSNGYAIGKTKIETMSEKMGFRTVYPMISHKRKTHKDKHEPYLLRGKTIFVPNQVWSTDITYINSLGYYLYLSVVFDWYSRKVVEWKLADKLSAEYSIQCIQDAIEEYGTPAIINSDQGAQYLSSAYKNFLSEHHIRQSMDISKRKYIDNIMIERWFRSLKNELIYLHNYKNQKELETAIAEYINFYNSFRPHTSFRYRTPNQIYYAVFKSSPVTTPQYQKQLDLISQNLAKTNRTNSFQEKLIWPEDTLKMLISDFESGMNLYELSHKYGHAWATIFKPLKDHGVDVSDETMRERKMEELKRKRKYNPDDVVRLYNEGKTIAEIGEIINLNHTTIQKILRENDIKGRTAAYYKKKEMLIKYDTDKVVELYVSGFSMDRIAEDLNIGRGTVSKILHRKNIAIRTSNDYDRTGIKRNRKRTDINDRYDRDHIKLIIKLYKQGYTAKRIGEITGHSTSLIQKILRRNKVKTRSTSDYKDIRRKQKRKNQNK